MHRRTWAPLALLSYLSLFLPLFLLLPIHAWSQVTGFVPAAGVQAQPTGLKADTFAVALDGRFATGTASASGATIVVYNHAAAAGREVLTTISDPQIKYLGGLAFGWRDTLLASENGTQDTVFAISLRTGAIQPLAPAGSIPNVAQVRVRARDGAVFAVASNAPGKGALYRIGNGAAVPVATSLGHGYLGGLAFDAVGDVLVGDTNDPYFEGKAGRVLILNTAGAPRGIVDLTAGQGSGAYDIAMDRRGVLYATTGSTVTAATPSGAFPLGHFTGSYPFPTDIAVDADGGILVNGNFTDVGEVFRIVPAAPSRKSARPICSFVVGK